MPRIKKPKTRRLTGDYIRDDGLPIRYTGDRVVTTRRRATFPKIVSDAPGYRPIDSYRGGVRKFPSRPVIAIRASDDAPKSS